MPKFGRNIYPDGRTQLMTKDEVVQKITKEWADQGKIIEGGWQALAIVFGLEDASPLQQREMRKAYFCGAQHLFAAILSTLDPGTEPTDADVHRLDLIAAELKAFTNELRLAMTQEGTKPW
jgi:hypothetical protein